MQPESDASGFSENAPRHPRALIRVESLNEDQLGALRALSPRDLSASLQLFVKAAYDQGSRQAVFGQVVVKDNRLYLNPRFELQPGIDYLVVCKLPQAEPITHEFSVPKPKLQPTTAVAQVYPTADIVPQNLLKFYIYFTAPMSQGDVYQHIELSTSDGRVLEHPFLEVNEELWDKSGKRLTLLLDPGRVKRGLVPREEQGPVLHAQSRYTLTIKTTCLDANGVPLAKSFSKKFLVGPEDFTQPNPANWRLSAPKSKSREAIVIDMPEPMDHATFARGVTVENAQGTVILGEITFAQHETRAYFRPLKPWRSGLFDLCISPLVEDLAGNSIERPFEIDRIDSINRPPAARKMVTIEIE